MGKLNGAVKWPHMIAVLTILTTVTLFLLGWIAAVDGKAFDRTEDMRKERMGQYERLAEKLNQVAVSVTRIETQQTTLMKEFRKDRNET